jgi:hypothetical protein
MAAVEGRKSRTGLIFSKPLSQIAIAEQVEI